jgi:hypothetical protein
LYLIVFTDLISFRKSKRDGQTDQSNLNLAYMIRVPDNTIRILVDTNASDLTIYVCVLRLRVALQFTATYVVQLILVLMDLQTRKRPTF